MLVMRTGGTLWWMSKYVHVLYCARSWNWDGPNWENGLVLTKSVLFLTGGDVFSVHSLVVDIYAFIYGTAVWNPYVIHYHHSAVTLLYRSTSYLIIIPHINTTFVKELVLLSFNKRKANMKYVLIHTWIYMYQKAIWYNKSMSSFTEYFGLNFVCTCTHTYCYRVDQC